MAINLRLPRGSNESSRYSHLSVCITEEDESYIVHVKLRSEMHPGDAAWGEEIADSIEEASLWVADIAARFAIPQHRVTLELRMENISENTRH